MEELKKKIRKECIAKRNKLDKLLKEELDKKIIKNFLEIKEYKEANKIFTYINFQSEINTLKLIEKMLLDKKRIFVPRVKDNKNMEIVEIKNLEGLEKQGKYSILEPKANIKSSTENMDLVIMPGVAFDLQLNRMGYGGGYYDRYLENKDIYKVALAYEFQVFHSIKTESHDVKVDLIVTEDRYI